MKTITEIQKYGLNKSIVSKTEIVASKKSNSTILFKFQSLKKINIEDVCAKLKNDLKWYGDDMPNSNVRRNERNFYEKTASKLVEEWWLGS